MFSFLLFTSLVFKPTTWNENCASEAVDKRIWKRHHNVFFTIFRKHLQEPHIVEWSKRKVSLAGAMSELLSNLALFPRIHVGHQIHSEKRASFLSCKLGECQISRREELRFFTLRTPSRRPLLVLFHDGSRSWTFCFFNALQKYLHKKFKENWIWILKQDCEIARGTRPGRCG